MTKGELLKRLREFPDDAEVNIGMPEPAKVSLGALASVEGDGGTIWLVSQYVS